MKRLMRRDFLKSGVGFLGVMGAVGPALATASGGCSRFIACQQYPWFTLYQREGRDFYKDFMGSMKEVAASGVGGFEPIVNYLGDIDAWKRVLPDLKLRMDSFYVNSLLHVKDRVDAEIEKILGIAERSKILGCRIVVTNPVPIRWGGDEDKSDAELEVQAEAMSRLGQELKKLGMVLAYHNHDAEMRQSAREFHHMMVGTDPDLVKLCLDAHWIYRGAGNSWVALWDVVQLYGDRVVEMHLRQSSAHIWTEAFGEGDLDYGRIWEFLKKKRVSDGVHLVLEQAVEAGTPHTLKAVEAHCQGQEYAERLFLRS